MSAQSLRQKTLTGMLWSGIQKFGTLIITFLSNIVLARLLTPSDYGLVGMLAIFIAISNTFIDGGFGSALIQKSKPTQKDYSTVFYWNIFLGIFLYFTLFFCAPFIAAFYDNITRLETILRVQGIVLIINSLTIVQFNQLRKSMKFKTMAQINVASASISVVIAISCALCGLGVWSLVIQQIALSASNGLLLWIICRWWPRESFSFTSLKQLFKFGSFMMMSSLVNTFGNNINGLIIGKFFSASTLGYYTQAKKIEDVSSMGMLTIVEQVTYPMLVEVKDDKKAMARVLGKFNSALLAVTTPLLLLIIILAKPIIIFLFSAKWLFSVHILQIISLHGIFLCMQGCNYNAIAALGESKALFSWSIVKRTFNLMLLFLGLWIWGFTGVLWSIVMSSLSIYLINVYLVQKYVNYSVLNQLKDLLPVVFVAAIPFVVIWSIVVFLFGFDYSSVVGLVSAITYVLMYMCLMLFTKHPGIVEIREVIFDYLKKIRHRGR